jgi:hypothetical protein
MDSINFTISSWDISLGFTFVEPPRLISIMDGMSLLDIPRL